MEFKTILVDLTDDEARDARLDAALTLADWSDGNVVGLSATGPLLDPYRSKGGEALRYEAMRGDMLRRLHAAGDAAIADALVRHPSTAGTSHVVIEQETGWALAVRGMASDIILPGLPGANRELPPVMASPAEYALVNSGKPLLIVPPRARLAPIETAVVAWNGRREAARALADAIPLLQRAMQVIIHVVITRHGPREHGDGELVKWLAAHGVRARLAVEEASSVAECLLRKLRDESADLLVAGGYGHSRIGELVMGGTTRTLIRNLRVPLVISH
ncbi:universal stress protein [Cupriavidus pauculus]|uniref:universal stress protein n=1 Tax=Cupriavidus pauculus TaxID=82633 RepID=UPI00385735E0